jgi:segregation and condensation protein B
MSYQTIRDMEDSLKKAAGGEDKQISIESLMNPKNEEDEEGESDDGDA